MPLPIYVAVPLNCHSSMPLTRMKSSILNSPNRFKIFNNEIHLPDFIVFVHQLVKQGELQSQTIGRTHSTSPCPIVVMLSAKIVGDKHASLSHWFDSTRIRTDEARIPLYAWCILERSHSRAIYPYCKTIFPPLNKLYNYHRGRWGGGAHTHWDILGHNQFVRTEGSVWCRQPSNT